MVNIHIFLHSGVCFFFEANIHSGVFKKIFHHPLLVTVEFSYKRLQRIDSFGFCICHLLLIGNKTVNILIEGFFLNLLLAVLFVKVFKFRKMNIFPVNGHQHRVGGSECQAHRADEGTCHQFNFHNI